MLIAGVFIFQTLFDNQISASKKEDVESVNKNDTSKKMSVERVYQKKTQLEHILLRPDTYIGSVEPLTQVSVTRWFTWNNVLRKCYSSVKMSPMCVSWAIYVHLCIYWHAYMHTNVYVYTHIICVQHLLCVQRTENWSLLLTPFQLSSLNCKLLWTLLSSHAELHALLKFPTKQEKNGFLLWKSVVNVAFAKHLLLLLSCATAAIRLENFEVNRP